MVKKRGVSRAFAFSIVYVERTQRRGGAVRSWFDKLTTNASSSPRTEGLLTTKGLTTKRLTTKGLGLTTNASSPPRAPRGTAEVSRSCGSLAVLDTTQRERTSPF